MLALPGAADGLETSSAGLLCVFLLSSLRLHKIPHRVGEDRQFGAESQVGLFCREGLRNVPAGDGFRFKKLFQPPNAAFPRAARGFDTTEKGPCPA